MSYAHAFDLQAAVFARLSGDPALTALVGTHIYDRAPEGASVPPLYVALGPEDADDASDSSGPAAVFRLTVTVVGTDVGFANVKQVAAAVCAALSGTNPVIAGGLVTGIQFRRARARRGDEPDQRLVELTFRTRVEETVAGT
ncbi:MAG: DUF3168 domain-containing protein [Rhodobacteraceae bacterium]|jgi:hypothetical protein|nr:DUF3168 domain-containing protein [Paracoccaceae bacterium]